MKETKDVTFLLVDDDEVDRQGVIRSFRKAKLSHQVVEATDGIQALEKLRGESDNEPVPRPYIILLDLNMPRMSGIEFLKIIRNDPKLKSSIVFVMTTSSSQRDKAEAYDLNVAGYVIKGDIGNDNSISQMVVMLEQYWRIVELPMNGV